MPFGEKKVELALVMGEKLVLECRNKVRDKAVRIGRRLT